MLMKDNVTIIVLAVLYVIILYMYISKITTFKRFSENALLKVESTSFFFSRKMHNIATVLIILLFAINLYVELQKGKGLTAIIVFTVVVGIVLIVHFKSMAASVWLIMNEGILLYGQKAVITWDVIEKFTWNMKASKNYNELFLFSSNPNKKTYKLRLLIDKELSKEAQRLFKKHTNI